MGGKDEKSNLADMSRYSRVVVLERTRLGLKERGAL